MPTQSTHTIVLIIRHIVIYLLVYIVNVETVPPLYCHRPLNTSDCNMKPTPVVSYYRSGSRCEVEYWRGCPTYNKFNNAYECTYWCIYRFRTRHEQEPLEEPPSENDLLVELMKIPEENLTVIEDIVKEMDEEIVKLKFNLPMSTEPAVETTITEAPETTTVAAPEEDEDHESSAEHKPETSAESGLPEEVETP